MPYKNYIFWHGRKRWHRREMFLEGLLELAEYLNDKTYGEGKVIYAAATRDRISFRVPLGDKMREKVLRPAVQAIATRYCIDKIGLRGRWGTADLDTYIDVYLPPYVLDMTSLHGEKVRAWNLEGFIHLQRDLIESAPVYPRTTPPGFSVDPYL